jgi:hypothetical protein
VKNPERFFLQGKGFLKTLRAWKFLLVQLNGVKITLKISCPQETRISHFLTLQPKKPKQAFGLFLF